ncbi:MAG: hypothetical protein IKE93_09975 [Erysipelotrichaceae bacterium]|nr:hypothetical protein [Erysipelotrichaceae bacterium]
MIGPANYYLAVSTWSFFFNGFKVRFRLFVFQVLQQTNQDETGFSIQTSTVYY